MIGIPERTESVAHYYTYIDQVNDPDILGSLTRQTAEMETLFATIGEEKSTHRYGPDKWTIREVLSHINDAERVFAFRAFWFARGFDAPMPSFDQNIAVAASGANGIPWADHVAEFRAIRQSTMEIFRHLPPDAWMKSGVASGNPITIRALAYVVCGHVAHHAAILRERYL